MVRSGWLSNCGKAVCDRRPASILPGPFPGVLRAIWSEVELLVSPRFEAPPLALLFGKKQGKSSFLFSVQADEPAA